MLRLLARYLTYLITNVVIYIPGAFFQIVVLLPRNGVQVVGVYLQQVPVDYSCQEVATALLIVAHVHLARAHHPRPRVAGVAQPESITYIFGRILKALI